MTAVVPLASLDAKQATASQVRLRVIVSRLLALRPVTARLAAKVMYYLYYLNSHRRGDLLVALASV